MGYPRHPAAGEREHRLLFESIEQTRSITPPENTPQNERKELQRDPATPTARSRNLVQDIDQRLSAISTNWQAMSTRIGSESASRPPLPQILGRLLARRRAA